MARPAFFVVALALHAFALSAAQAQGMVLSGAEWNRSAGYLYAGYLQPLGDAQTGSGWRVRHWLDATTYTYDAAPGAVRAVGIAYAPALGYGASGEGWAAAAYLGVRLGHLRLNPQDAGNDNRGTRGRLFAQLDGQHQVGGHWQHQYVLQSDLGHHSYYARSRWVTAWGDGLSLGPEMVRKAAPQYRAWQIGLALGGLRAGPQGEWLLRAGFSGERNGKKGAYLGVEWLRPF